MSTHSPTADTTLTIERTFNAPAELVYRAWTEAAMMKKWACPTGFRVDFCESDPRVGGTWRRGMTSPDNKPYISHGTFTALTPSTLIEMSHVWEVHDDIPGVDTTIRITLEAAGARTKMVFQHIGLPNIQERDSHGEGWSEAFEHLQQTVESGGMNAVADLTGSSVQIGEREMIISRSFDAPRALLWKAFTNPTHLAKWWGPRGFSTTTKSMDFRVGGQWAYTMHGPDGTDYENLITYTRIDAEKRIEYTHGPTDSKGDVCFGALIELVDEGKRTRVNLRMVFPDTKMRDMVTSTYGAVEGGKQTLSRLGEFVETLDASGAPAQATFTFNRVLKAPRELVFKAWTEKARLDAWFGPKGMPITKSTLDLRVGGAFHYAMKLPTGELWWGKWVFREIVPSEKLVFVSSFSNEKGEVVRAPFSDDFPKEVLSTVIFSPHAGVGLGTLVSMVGVPLNAAANEHAFFGNMTSSMNQGWGGTFEQLEAFLRKA